MARAKTHAPGDAESEALSRDELAELNHILKAWREMNYELCSATIPSDLDAHFGGKNSAVGASVSFHERYARILPDYEDRVRLLNDLARNPGWLERGLVDPARGIVYHHSGRRGWRRKRLWAVIGFGLSVLAALWVAAWLWPGTSANWTDPAVVRVPAVWLIILAGTLIHTIVGTTRRAQETGTRPPPHGVQTLLPWVEVLSGVILWKMVLAAALVGPLILVTPPGDAYNLLLLALFVGYGLDSILEVVANSIEQKMNAVLTANRRRAPSTEPT